MQEQFNSNQPQEYRPENPFSTGPESDAPLPQTSEEEHWSQVIKEFNERNEEEKLRHLGIDPATVLRTEADLEARRNRFKANAPDDEYDHDTDGIPGIDGDWHNGVCPMERRH